MISHHVACGCANGLPGGAPHHRRAIGTAGQFEFIPHPSSFPKNLPPSRTRVDIPSRRSRLRERLGRSLALPDVRRPEERLGIDEGLVVFLI